LPGYIGLALLTASTVLTAFWTFCGDGTGGINVGIPGGIPAGIPVELSPVGKFV
jgi:hypothetical protein